MNRRDRSDPAQIERLQKSAKQLSGIPDEKSVVIEKRKGSAAIVVHSCFGTKINQTLATMLSTLLSSKIGYLVETKSDAYRIILSTSGPLETKHVSEGLREAIDLRQIPDCLYSWNPSVELEDVVRCQKIWSGGQSRPVRSPGR